jgi:hypothetical protein
LGETTAVKEAEPSSLAAEGKTEQQVQRIQPAAVEPTRRGEKSGNDRLKNQVNH